MRLTVPRLTLPRWSDILIIIGQSYFDAKVVKNYTVSFPSNFQFFFLFFPTELPFNIATHFHRIQPFDKNRWNDKVIPQQLVLWYPDRYWSIILQCQRVEVVKKYPVVFPSKFQCFYVWFLFYFLFVWENHSLFNVATDFHRTHSFESKWNEKVSPQQLEHEGMLQASTTLSLIQIVTFLRKMKAGFIKLILTHVTQ